MKKSWLLILLFLLLLYNDCLSVKQGKKDFLIDDFEAKDKKDALGGDWQIISDVLYCNGTSKSEMKLSTGQDNSQCAIKTVYTLGKHWGSDPFVNLISKYQEEQDFYHGIQGIKFWIRGSGQKLRLVLPSVNINDYNYWGFIINRVPDQWQEITVLWTDLRPGWGSTRPLADSLIKVTELQFHTEAGKPGESGWFEVDNVSLILDENAGSVPLIGRLSALEQERSRPEIDVNQAFYSSRGKKLAVIRCAQKLENGRFSILRQDKECLSGDLLYLKEYWNKHFWQLDFSSLKKTGEYLIRVSFNNTENEAKVCISDDLIQQAVAKTLDYFRIQRCGTDAPGWHKTCHLDDGVLPDGSAFDAVGGWHDCAGFDKEMYTTFLPVYFYTTIGFASALDWKERMLEEARWGADWIMKMTDKDGNIWCHVDPHNLSPSDFIKVWSNGVSTDNIRGNSDDRKITTNAWGPEEGVQASCMGSLVKLAYLLRGKDREYSGKCLDKAKKIMNYLTTAKFYRQGKFVGQGHSHYNLFHSGLLLADIYLYKMEQKEKYLKDARKRIDFILSQCRNKDGEYLNSSIEKVPVSAKSFDPYFNLVIFYDYYQNFPKDAYSKKIKEEFRHFMKQVMKRVDSPYGQAQVIDSELKDWIAIKTFQRNFEKPGQNISQGKNCYWLSLATVCFLAEKILKTGKYVPIAIQQVDWVLGKNPFGMSTAGEIGYRFPRMFTMYYWLENHPGAEGVMPGGVINGIGGDKNDHPYLDLRNNNYMAWETNEYWNPPTAWLAMACWLYYQWALK